MAQNCVERRLVPLTSIKKKHVFGLSCKAAIVGDACFSLDGDKSKERVSNETQTFWKKGET